MHTWIIFLIFSLTLIYGAHFVVMALFVLWCLMPMARAEGR